MGSSTTTTNKYDTRVTDPFSQYGLGKGQRQQFGQAAYGGALEGLDAMRALASGNFGGGGGFGGGGSRGGGGGGGSGYNQYITRLGNEPVFSSRNMKAILGSGTEDAERRYAAESGQLSDYMTRSGITGPAALRARQRMEMGQADRSAQGLEGRRIKAAELQNQNLGLAGQYSTGIDQSRIAAGAQRYAADRSAGASMFGDKLRAQLGAAGALGDFWRQGGAPYDVAHLNTYSKQKQSPGALGIIGGGLGIDGSLFGGPLGGMIGGGLGSALGGLGGGGGYGGGGGASFLGSPAGGGFGGLGGPLNFNWGQPPRR